MRLVDADSLKENGFVVPKTFKKGDVYLEVRAEDMATETAPVRRFFINDEIIDAIPTIEAEPVKHGMWEMYGAIKRGALAIPIYRCSECKEDTNNWFWRYCPNCGARMDGGENG